MREFVLPIICTFLILVLCLCHAGCYRTAYMHVCVHISMVPCFFFVFLCSFSLCLCVWSLFFYGSLWFDSNKERTFPGLKDSFIHGNATSESEFGHGNGLPRNTGGPLQNWKGQRGPTDFYRRPGDFYRFHCLKITLLSLTHALVHAVDGCMILHTLQYHKLIPVSCHFWNLKYFWSW